MRSLSSAVAQCAVSPCLFPALTLCGAPLQTKKPVRYPSGGGMMDLVHPGGQDASPHGLPAKNKMLATLLANTSSPSPTVPTTIAQVGQTGTRPAGAEIREPRAPDLKRTRKTEREKLRKKNFKRAQLWTAEPTDAPRAMGQYAMCR